MQARERILESWLLTYSTRATNTLLLAIAEDGVLLLGLTTYALLWAHGTPIS